MTAHARNRFLDVASEMARIDALLQADAFPRTASNACDRHHARLLRNRQDIQHANTDITCGRTPYTPPAAPPPLPIYPETVPCSE